MDILDYAMKMEKDGESFYRQLAKDADSKGVKTIFAMLADEEVRHFNIIQKIKSRTPQQIQDSQILNDVKNVFVQIKESGEKIDYHAKQSELYKKAQDIEELSRKFYLDKAAAAMPEHKKIFLKLAEEEKKHYFLLENIIQFVSRPEQWLENAEFCHLEDY